MGVMWHGWFSRFVSVGWGRVDLGESKYERYRGITLAPGGKGAHGLGWFEIRPGPTCF